MFKVSKNSMMKFMGAISLVLFTIALNQINISISYLETIKSKVAIFLFIILIIFWGIEIQKRLLDRHIKIIFLIVDALMIFLNYCKFLRYDFFYYSFVSELLWYFYYIPIIFIPVFVLSSSLQISNVRYKKIKYFKWVYGIAAILCVIVLTNHYHNLVFIFIDNNVDSYRYGFIYYIIYGWLIILAIASIVICYYRSKSGLLKKRLWVQWIWIVFTILYSIYYVKGPFLLKSRIIQLPEFICLIFMGFIEFSIQAGLYPTNGLYVELFDNSSISAIIKDNDDRIVFNSANGQAISEEMIEITKNNAIRLYGDKLIHNQKINNGSIVWLDDVKTINQLTSSLNEIKEQISGENELLKAENELKRKETAVKEKTKLYNLIDEHLQPYFEKTKLLLSELNGSDKDYKQRLALACFYMAYIKRVSNLLIISQQNALCDIRELYLSINELLHQLSYLNISNMCINKNEARMPSESLTLMYQIILEILEDCLQDIDSCFITINGQSSFVEVRIQLSGSNINVDLGDVKDSLVDYYLSINQSVEDDEYYYTITYKGDSI